jgi:hypothetical protein
MNDCFFAKLVGFDQLLEGSRSRRGEDTLGDFVMVAFRKGDGKMASIAHEYLELAYMCALQSGRQKLIEAFINEFYEHALLKNTTASIQAFFFTTSAGSNVSIQLAYLISKLKYGLGLGLCSTQESPVVPHLNLLRSAIKLTKNKVDLEIESCQLGYAAFNASIRPLFSPRLSSFRLGRERTPWLTVKDLESIKELVVPALKNRKKTWNPYLVPYRLLFGKADIEVIVISNGSSREDETQITKRLRYDPFEIEIDKDL